MSLAFGYLLFDVLRYTLKKVDAAFDRYIERRKRLRPELNHQRDISKEVGEAAKALDLQALLHFVVELKAKSEQEYIEDIGGVFNFLYYNFVKGFHCYPRSVDDLVDGSLYLEMSRILERREMEKLK